MLIEFWTSFNKVIRSRLGLLLAVINWSLLIFFYFTRENTGEPVHLYHESVWFQIVLLLNIPAIGIVTLIAFLFGYNDSIGERYWIIGLFVSLLFIIGITFQWMPIGYTIEKIINNVRKPKDSSE
jgi:small-conductance mechanosensitive channel